MPNQEIVLDTVFRALADPTRRAVVQRLSSGPATVTELAQPFEMALPSFLQHLKVLEESGLVRSRKLGRVRRCEIAPASLEVAETWIGEQRAIWQARLDRMEAVVNELKAKEGRDGE